MAPPPNTNKKGKARMSPQEQLRQQQLQQQQQRQQQERQEQQRIQQFLLQRQQQQHQLQQQQQHQVQQQLQIENGGQNTPDEPKRYTTDWQQLRLVELLKELDMLVTQKFASNVTKAKLTDLWNNTIAPELNRDRNGATKDGKGWRDYWNTLKSSIKSKATQFKKEQQKTGGGSNKAKPLNEVQTIIYNFLEPVTVDGDSNVAESHVPLANLEEQQDQQQQKDVRQDREQLAIVPFVGQNQETVDEEERARSYMFTLNEERDEAFMPRRNEEFDSFDSDSESLGKFSWSDSSDSLDEIATSNFNGNRQVVPACRPKNTGNKQVVPVVGGGSNAKQRGIKRKITDDKENEDPNIKKAAKEVKGKRSQNVTTRIMTDIHETANFYYDEDLELKRQHNFLMQSFLDLFAKFMEKFEKKE